MKKCKAKGGSVDKEYGTAKVGQHERMATGHMGTINKLPSKIGGSVKGKKK
jgi:hypothetical protein